MTSPVIIGSERSEIGLPLGMRALRACEDNLADHYVGTAGLPNARGVVELDASLMIGSSRAFGAVAGLQGYPNPVSVARAVIERLPQHCLLVGEGAATFAAECGFQTAELLTEESRRLFTEALQLEDSVEGERTAAQEGDRAYRTAALDLVKRFAPHDGPWGTINVIALDQSGEMVVGVSTSGYPWKYPGRVGDSALPGAGNWCDLRAGGAACTGRGELSLRAGTARSVVDALGRGQDVEQACLEALADAATLPDTFRAELRVLALTPDGRHGGAAGVAGSTYAVMTADMAEPASYPRSVL
jgi:isoaspartyl peptidase/L-asparaginase-like protein (Ntn-hydrolase superfamily)